MHTKKQRIPTGTIVAILHIQMGEQGVEDFIGKFLDDHPGSDREMAMAELDTHRIVGDVEGDSFLPSLLPFLVNGGVSVSIVPRAPHSTETDIFVTVK